MRRWRRALWACVLLLAVTPAQAGEVRVAVASNFAPALEDLAPAFTERTGHRLRLSPGSTGKLYAQIRRGAPFDVFLAADRARPERLEREGHIVSGSRFTYARGQLVLWSLGPSLPETLAAALEDERLAPLALANPALAPYGRAARQTLERLGLWREREPSLVRGENIAQTYQYVATGHAPLGLVALSQYRQRPRGEMRPVPTDLHEPIEQQGVLLRDTPEARALLEFLQSEPIRERLRELGYEVPPQEGP